jgi:hypothetical protein
VAFGLVAVIATMSCLDGACFPNLAPLLTWYLQCFRADRAGRQPIPIAEGAFIVNRKGNPLMRGNLGRIVMMPTMCVISFVNSVMRRVM